MCSFFSILAEGVCSLHKRDFVERACEVVSPWQIISEDEWEDCGLDVCTTFWVASPCIRRCWFRYPPKRGFSLEYWLARNRCKSGVSDLTILYVDRGDENGIPVVARYLAVAVMGHQATTTLLLRPLISDRAGSEVMLWPSSLTIWRNVSYTQAKQTTDVASPW
jgi:hypothetical protein